MPSILKTMQSVMSLNTANPQDTVKKTSNHNLMQAIDAHYVGPKNNNWQMS